MSRVNKLLKLLSEQDDEFIDLQPLEDAINKKLGTDLSLGLVVTKGRNDSLDITSKELKDEAGVMSKLYKTLKIKNFGGGYDEKKGHWIPINFMWSYELGGSNGTDILIAWYSTDKEWTFR